MTVGSVLAVTNQEMELGIIVDRSEKNQSSVQHLSRRQIEYHDVLRTELKIKQKMSLCHSNQSKICSHLKYYMQRWLLHYKKLIVEVE